MTTTGTFVECGRCGAHLYPTAEDSTTYMCGNGHDLGAEDIALEWDETADLIADETDRVALYVVTTDPAGGEDD